MNEDLEQLETRPQLEVILKSIKNETVEMLTPILKSEDINGTIKARVKKYIHLIDINHGNTMDNTILQREFPELDFNDINPITDEELSAYINMYIYKEKSISTARLLSDLSSDVREKGISTEVLDKLSSLTKSDIIRHKFHNVKDDIASEYENKELNVGLNTGVAFVDELTGGIHKGEISTIVAFTGHCKTTWAVNICYNALIAHQQNILYLTLEVPADALYMDFLSRHSNDQKFKGRKINHYNLKKRLLKPEEWEYMKDTIMPDFNALPAKVYVVGEKELDNYSIFGLEAKFREVDKIATEETGHGIDVVAIDHMQLLKFNSGHQTTNTGEIINEYVSWFRQMSMDWLKSGRQVAFLLLSQANRNGYNEAHLNNGKYSLTAVAEANELERASTVILSIYAETEMKALGNAKVQILKCRDNSTEDEPTEVNIDLKYYLFGDSEVGEERISSSISNDTGNLINDITSGDNTNDDILSTFAGLTGNSDFSL